jgi:mRNA-degrading endonuclease RelE of RelBE toxin-antitoxin system
MTQVGAGGVSLTRIQRTKRFTRDYGKLTPELQERTNEKLKGLLKNPRPPGLAFEKLKGYRRPDIYTLHVTGNYKLSFEIEGATAILRRVAPHDELDRAP